jgi:hypothetical protein
MKQKSLHIFLSNNLVTAVHLAEGKHELIFSDIHLSNIDNILTLLTPFYSTHIRFVLDTPNVMIKSIDLEGMNYWHQYQLSRRLANETKSDWHSLWKENKSLILLKGNLSELERTFLKLLIAKKFLIESIVPALWILTNTLLKGHTLRKNGIVHFSLHDQIQQVLYLNGLPTISRVTHNIDTSDWEQFVQAKYKTTLDTLDAERLIRSLGSPTDTFPTYALTHMASSRCPAITFHGGLNLKRYSAYTNFGKQCAYGMATLGVLFIAAMTPKLIDMNTHQLKLDTLINKERDILETYTLDDTLTKASQTYMHKRNVVESFNAQSFPAMSFLERLSTILPNYGQVVYLRLIPKVSKLNTVGTDEFAVHLRIVPSKNSKSLQLLTTELHKVFGSKLRINIIKNPTIQRDKSQDDAQLKHAVQINLTGLMHDLQRLTP